MTRAALVVQPARHHSGASGYHQLAIHLVAQGEAVECVHGFPRRGTWRLAEPLAKRSGVRWYGAEACLTEIWAAAVASWRRPVLHFLQGENSYRYAGLIPGNPRRRLVATLHLPPSCFGAYVGTTVHLERLDALVLVARNQLAIVDGLRRRPATFVVPHGIDTDFFRPAGFPVDDAPCLMVGQWLRDLPVLRETVGRVRAARPATRFVLVLPAEQASAWRGVAGVEVRSCLDDAALLETYRHAALLVMPLLDCTANNSLLEAMACGLPSVVSDVGGIRDYVDRNCARLVRAGKPDDMAEAVLDLLRDPVARETMGRAARQRAETFAWPRVAQQILSVYEAVR
jgi:glycosyltransferase involved in cell wall biosynthesis